MSLAHCLHVFALQTPCEPGNRPPISHLPARADLGDTYATSCQRYGPPGLVDKSDGTIAWSRQGYLITEQFHHDQCVAIVYNQSKATPSPRL